MKSADEVAEEWLRVWQYINNAMHQQRMLQNQQQSEVESERDSTESSCTDKNRAHSNSSGTSDEGPDEAQPLNLSLTTNNALTSTTKQGYNHDFIMNSTSHKTGMLLINLHINEPWNFQVSAQWVENNICGSSNLNFLPFNKFEKFKI